MESVLLVFLSSFLLTVNSHPRNPDLLPKDYYKRQILQPIPGYIPVYIKADGDPIIRSENFKLESGKVPGENQLSKKQIEAKSKNTERDQMNTEIHIKALKNEPKSAEPTQRQINEKEKLSQPKLISSGRND